MPTRAQLIPTTDLVLPSSRLNGCDVVHVIGVVDSSTVWKFRQAIAELPAASQVVLDISKLSFVDSSGLGAVIGGVRRVRELGGDMRLAGPIPSIRRVLEVTGLDRIAEVHPDVAAALSDYSEQDLDRTPSCGPGPT
ncbi:MAG: STAS domain-containing protein [Acidobacteriota bacterium]|nr:STAS domain-containing protein [Acidobacteriota bacterium]